VNAAWHSDRPTYRRTRRRSHRDGRLSFLARLATCPLVVKVTRLRKQRRLNTYHSEIRTVMKLQVEIHMFILLYSTYRTSLLNTHTKVHVSPGLVRLTLVTLAQQAAGFAISPFRHFGGFSPLKRVPIERSRCSTWWMLEVSFKPADALSVALFVPCNAG